MEIWHRVMFNTSNHPNLETLLIDLHIEFHAEPAIFSNGKIIHFRITESDSRWPSINTHLADTSNLVITEFTESEICAAEWVRVIPVFEHMYPEPQDVWISTRPGIELTCNECSTFVQKSPYSVRREPKWGRFRFLTLYWVYELFARPEVVEALHANGIRGFQPEQVLLSAKPQPLNDLVQLDIPTVLEPALTAPGVPFQRSCPRCGVPKYYPHVRGVMHLHRRPFDKLEVDLAKTHEWFGGGKNAFREIIASRNFADLVQRKGWKGLQFKVVELH